MTNLNLVVALIIVSFIVFIIYFVYRFITNEHEFLLGYDYMLGLCKQNDFEQIQSTLEYIKETEELNQLSSFEEGIMQAYRDFHMYQELENV